MNGLILPYWLLNATRSAESGTKYNNVDGQPGSGDRAREYGDCHACFFLDVDFSTDLEEMI